LTRSSFAATPGRLDTVTAGQLGVPRADVQRAIALGRVLVDGQPREKSFRLSGGERIDADLPSPGELEPDSRPLTVLYEDEHLMVVSKPAGVPSHPTASRRTGTLVNMLLARATPLSTAGGEDRPGIVHRLDAGTSGAMVVAKDDQTHSALTDMFRRHAVERRYLALVRGTVKPDNFLIEAPLDRRRARIRVDRITGREAATEIEVKERLDRATLVEARPKTGRTHQIRVHLSSVGHPVLGDRAYGGGGDEARRLHLSRPFLHSWRIAFDHPISGERIELDDLLPEDLTKALHLARRD
jgi:23S rRNA pseudouridine1911/1915/1917 synthase